MLATAWQIVWKPRERAQRALRCETVAEEMERRGQIKEMFRRENYK